MFKTISIVVLTALLGVVTFSYVKYLVFNDISTEPVHTASHPDFNSKDLKHRPGVYLVSYADGHEVFFKNQSALNLSGLNKGIHFFMNYNRSDLDQAFLDKHKERFKKRRGAGYWVWKPYIILKTMEMVPEDSIVIYADVGFVFRKPIQPLIDIAKKHDIVLIKFNPKIWGYAKNGAKREALERADCLDSKCLNGYHLWSAFSIFRNTENARKFVRQWLELNEIDAVADDSPSSKPEFDFFWQHQHDETTMLLTASKERDRVYLIDRDQLTGFVGHHHRHPSTVSRTLIPKMSKHIRGIEEKILNSRFFKWLRETLLAKYEVNDHHPSCTFEELDTYSQEYPAY